LNYFNSYRGLLLLIYNNILSGYKERKHLGFIAIRRYKRNVSLAPLSSLKSLLEENRQYA
jgi:hypothetical protein